MAILLTKAVGLLLDVDGSGFAGRAMVAWREQPESRIRGVSQSWGRHGDLRAGVEMRIAMWGSQMAIILRKSNPAGRCREPVIGLSETHLWLPAQQCRDRLATL